LVVFIALVIGWALGVVFNGGGLELVAHFTLTIILYWVDSSVA